MLASGPLALTAFFSFLASAQLEPGARIETRVGEIPQGTNTQQTLVMLLATPSLRLLWVDGPDSLRADLATRILWRPVPLLNSRPLFLETFGLSHTVRPSTRSQSSFDLRATYGEEDYTALSRQFATQPTLPLSRTMLMVEGAASTLWRSSRRTTLVFGLGAAHRRALGEPTSSSNSAAGSVPAFPAQTMVSMSPALQFAMSRRSSVELALPVSDYNIQQSGQETTQRGVTDIAAVQPQIRLNERLAQRQQLRLVAGITYARALRGASSDFGYHLTPLAQIGLDSGLVRNRAWTMRSSVDATSSWYVDQVLGRGTWRATLDARVDAQIGQRWSSGLRLGLTTDLSPPPAQYTSVDRTLVSADASVRYHWTHVLVAELGGRFSERSPSLSLTEFAWHARELWAFVSLYTATRISLTTVRSTTTGSDL